jgi:hypothetical protein
MRKYLIVIAAGIIVLLAFVGITQFITVNKAHSSFDNYYKFRGCTKLISRSDTEATCQLSNGSTIKIVKYHNKWYLDGDLPTTIFGIDI